MDLIQMSLAAGVLIAGITLFRAVFVRRIPKKVMMILWGIVVLRLLFPASIPLPGLKIGGFMSQLPQAQSLYIPDIEAGETEEVAQYAVEETVIVTVEEASADTWGRGLTLIYLLGAAVMVLGSVYLYVRDGRFFRESLPMEEREKEYLLGQLAPEEKKQKYLGKVRFRISDRTATPVTYGIFRLAVVFPKGIFLKEEKELRFCLLHELVHIRNHDNLRKLIVHGALCIHWFNPLVWGMYFLVNRDMELLCDERAVRKCRADRQDYALALLSLAERRAMGFYTALGFGKNAVKERILAVMWAGKTTAGGVLAAAFAVVLAITVFLGSQAVVTAANSEVTADYAIAMESTGDMEYDAVTESAEATVDAGTAEAAPAAVMETAEGTLLPGTLIISLQELGEEFRGQGLSVRIMPDDYQLYFKGTPVYFFADNQNQDGEGFSGRVFAKKAGGENGDTGVETMRDENGVIVGLVNLSAEESKELARAWTGGY